MSEISSAEWEVMRVVWTKEKTTSRFIIDVLSEKYEWSDSTVKTLLRRLVDKNMLSSMKEGKKFIYQAKVQESDAILSDIKGRFEKICLKKQRSVLMELIKNVPMTLYDIELLEKVLQEKKKTAVKEVFCNCIKGQCRCKGEKS